MSDQPTEGNRPLHRLFKMAVMAGVEDSVRLHIRRGDDVNARDDKGLTPLMIAASRNRAGTCKLLLDSGADAQLLNPAGLDALTLRSLTSRARMTQLPSSRPRLLSGPTTTAIPVSIVTSCKYLRLS